MSAAATILIVDDNPGLRRLLADVLAGDGWRCIVAASGADALRMVEEGIATIDLLLSGVIIQGGIDGIQLARRIRELQPHARAVLMTGYFDRNHLRTLERAGFPILLKPLAIREVRETLRRELQRRDEAVVIRFPRRARTAPPADD